MPGRLSLGLAVLLGGTAATAPGLLASAAGPATRHGVRVILDRVPGDDPGAQEVTHGWTPRMQRVVDAIRSRWPAVSCGGQADGSQTGHIPGSDHYSGNAADCASGRYGIRATGAAKATGDAVAAWVTAQAGPLHVKYVIWYARIDELDGRGWQPYCDQLDPSCVGVTYEHYDHVHVSVR